jgi:hypothetical protein
MTMLCERLATPSERLLRVGEEEEDPEVDAAYAKAVAALLAAREADRYCLGLSHFAVFGAGLEAFATASTQYMCVDDPRRVIFDTTFVVSGSALASAMMVAISGGVAVLGDYRQFPAPVLRPPFSLYGSPIEGFGHQVTDFAPYASAVLAETNVEWLAIGGEALSTMDQASAEYRSRRAEARAEERRLRRYDRE